MIDKSPHSVLLVSSGEKGAEAIAGLLNTNEFRPVQKVKSAAEARLCLNERDFDIIIINAPLKDEFGISLSSELAESTFSGVLLLVKNDSYEFSASKTEDLGVLTISRPIEKSQFLHALKLLSAERDRFLTLENENKKLKQKLDEVKLVNRAKRALMECLNMTEAGAHRYIEKQAMDLRITKYEVAKSIIKTYTDSY